MRAKRFDEEAERRSPISLVRNFFKRSGDYIFKEQQSADGIQRSPLLSTPSTIPQSSSNSGNGNGQDRTSILSLASMTSKSLPSSDPNLINSDPSLDHNANLNPNDPNMRVNNYDGNSFDFLTTYEGGGFNLPDVLEETPSDPDSDIGWDAAWPRPYPYFTIRHEFKHKRIFFGMSVTLTKPVTKTSSNAEGNRGDQGDGVSTSSGNTGLGVNSGNGNTPYGNQKADLTTPLGKANPNSNPNTNLKSGTGGGIPSVGASNSPILVTSSNPNSNTQSLPFSPPSSPPISDLAMLKSLPGVKAVFPVRYVPRPRPHGSAVLLSSPAQARGAVEEAKNTLHMTGVEDLHRQGIDGRGVRVAVLDTGIDYNRK